jgi:protein phosphatase
MAEPMPACDPVMLEFDSASALGLGRRERQEDAVVTDFSAGGDFGLAVLADGMGGHASGEIASKIVVTEVFSDLILRRNDLMDFARDIPGALTRAAQSANDCLRGHVARHPEAQGMGATLLAVVIIGDALHWLSVGDSPLYLFRGNRLRQLNQDHSMAPEIDLMARRGEIDRDAAQRHPERNVLTSALFGDQIARIDCPAAPVRLIPGDTLIVASDGVQVLAPDEIAALLRAYPMCRSDQLAARLMDAVAARDDPDQDNTALSVIRLRAAGAPDPMLSAQSARRAGFPNLIRVSRRLWQEARITASPVTGGVTDDR